MSLSAKREALARIHGRYQRAGQPHQTRMLDEFCALCGYHRKAALRLMHRPLPSAPTKRSGPNIIYEPAQVLPVLMRRSSVRMRRAFSMAETKT